MTNLKFAAALFSIIMIISPHCVTAQQISGAKFIMNTKDDDKDSDEAINIKIIKNETIILYNSGWVHKDITFHNGKPNDWDTTKSGNMSPISLSDCDKLHFRVEKEGEKGWEASFQVISLDEKVILVRDTPNVRFGKKTDIRIHNPLDGLSGVKVTHIDGGSWHEFGFTCR